ncbi:MAG: hypothetical protein QOF78_704 [Phycisphaerales bacterium]|jgi:hypothetical protein|nr:hypothetical protein [Phycisphaerales bacterium]
MSVEPLDSNTPPAPVVVLGLYRSGSSCIAGLLHRLGLHLGAHLVRANQHNESGYYEPAWLSGQLRKMWNEPQLIASMPQADRVHVLKWWLGDQQRRAQRSGKRVAVKHPLLCVMGEEMIEAWGSDIQVIAVCRPLDESVQSLQRTRWWHPSHCRPLLEKMWEQRERFLGGLDHLRVDYDAMRHDPAGQAQRIVNYLRLSSSPTAMKEALAFVRPPCVLA